ncbi:MAG: sodium:solute symporter family protein, partial [Gammaproteobacteria bacterium]
MSRAASSEQDYLLGGRKLGPGLVLFSVFATWFGAETCIGASGEVFAKGLSGASVDPFGYAICVVLMGLLFAAPLWRMGLVTLADLFRRRYGEGVEWLATLIMIPTSLLWAAAQVRAFGQIVAAPTDIGTTMAISIAAAVVIVYTTAGGLMADAVSDLLQGLVLIAGLVLIGCLVMQGGGWEALRHAEPMTLTAPGSGWLATLETWSVPVLGSLVAQELVSRVIAARNAAVARNSTIAAGVLYLAVGLIPVSLGLAAAHLLPADSEPEQVMALLAGHYLPIWAYVVFIGALVSAILSTVDTTLLACGSLTAHNLILPLRPETSERGRLMANRMAVVVYGILAYLIALSGESVFALVQEASSLGSAGILVILVFGLYTQGFGGRIAAYAALICGLIV